MLLLGLSVLPVIALLIYIYRKDKYEKEPIGQLVKAFFGGILAIPVTFLFVYILNSLWYSETVFYRSFLEAGLVEELSKLIILFLFIWRNRNFNEYMDGIVYAVFIGMGFACIENILYVYSSGLESYLSGIGTSVIRALLSVPGHFLFAVIMGYFFDLAKFEKKHKMRNISLALFFPFIAHGVFDWLLMHGNELGSAFAGVIYILFIVFDIYLWRAGLKFIRSHQKISQLAAEAQQPSFDNFDASGKEPEYKSIDWQAGDRKD